MEEVDSRKDTPRQRTVSSSSEITEEQLHATISRVLQCSFKEPSDRYIYLPQVAEFFKQLPTTSLQDITSQCFMEILFEFANGSNPFSGLLLGENNDTSSLNSFSVSPTQNLSPSPSPVNTCPIPLLPLKGMETNNPQSVALNYLLECYARVAVEERNHPKRSSIPPLSDLLSDIRAQAIHYTTLIIQGYIIPSEIGKLNSTLLLKPLLQQSLPRGFLSELVTRTHANKQLFSKIFSPLLQDLFLTMQDASIVGNEHREPLQALHELAEIRCGGRPICTLITQQEQFLPEPCTQAAGREITRTSYLGPFLSISVFAEDEPKVAEKFFSGNSTSDKSLNHTLQQELENSRSLLHKIFHSVLANSTSRDAMLNYMSKLLMYNEKRSQLQMEERNLAGDGFMLNLLSVLQMLAVKVKLDKVDFLYPFHPNAVIDIKNDTRLKFTSQETADWLEELCK